ncbi:MAG: sulfurtransferase [Bacteroidales bacterium]|nr:sulfurtransferase [Bacteroidales bacterium]MCF8338107.1 sulfurtransferase [Bacteroidales bacterium]
MKELNKRLITLTISVLLAGALYAQSPVIEAGEFKSAAKGDNVVVVDANTASTFNRMHVKGAVNIPHLELYKDGDIKGILKEPDKLADYFGSKGITTDKKFIIYDDGSQKYNSRVYWTLRYLGADNVHLLHKDMNKWRKERIRLTRRGSKPASATFTPKVQDQLKANAAEVKKGINDNNVILLDSRAKGEYEGKEKKSKGHIKSAVNINYKDILDENGAFLPKSDMKIIFEEKGITPDKEIIAYCKTSVRAAVNFVALKDILGYPNVKVYDGAYLEWESKYPNLIEQ